MGDLVFGAKPGNGTWFCSPSIFRELVVWLDLEARDLETLFSYTPKRLIKWYDKSIACH